MQQAEKRRIKADVLALERKIKELNETKEDLQKKFELPLSGDEILEISKSISNIEKEIDLSEEKWFSLSEKLED